MEPKELARINVNAKRLINEYIKSKGYSISGFAKKVKVNPNQLFIYLCTEEKKGLHSATLQKIGEYIWLNK